MTEIRKFSALRKSIPIELELEEGVDSKFFIKEMTGAMHGDYANAQMQTVEKDKNGEIVGLKDYKRAYTLVLSYTLYDEAGKIVPEETVAKWPNTLLKALAELAVELNGLKPVEGEDPTKKD